MTRRGAVMLIALAGTALGVCVLRLLVGAGGLALPEDADILALRGLRVLAGAGVGACLGLGGVLLQTLLRNPLASPDLIGPTAGAGLGVMLAVYLAFVLLGEIGGLPAGASLGALGGSLSALVLVYGLSQRRGLIDPVTMVLVGVMLSVIAGAATLLLQGLLPDRGYTAARWFLGGLSDDSSWTHAWGTLAVASCAVALATWRAPMLDATLLSADEARSVGVPLGRVRAALFGGAGVLAAAAVLLAGPVGFVGLVCPHAVRLIGGSSHRSLAPGSALAGIVLVVGADTLIKSLNLASGRLPLGVVTALVGGPIFIVLLLREARR